MPDYKEIATDARIAALKLIYNAQTSHLASCFSVADILAVLFEKADLKKDKIILSCGWKAAIFYHFLANKGFFTHKELEENYCKDGSLYIGLVEPSVNGIEYSGGSMGHGLPAAVGYALSKKLKGEEGTVYCLMSDGELAIGTTWESALIAAHHKLDNLKVIIDYNFLQAMGRTKEILDIGNAYSDWDQFGTTLNQKFVSFGWNVMAVDGHKFNSIEQSVDFGFGEGMPCVAIVKTTKGKGVSFMEGENQWHYRAPNKDEFDKALEELCHF